MPKISYWEKRAQEAMKFEQEQDIKAVQEIERIINATTHDIEQAIYAFYAKYADKESISIAEAKKRVDAFDVQLFKDKAKHYVANNDFSDKANKELALFNTKMYISREELLKAQLGFLLTKMTAESESKIDDYMRKGAYQEIERQAGILGESVKITDRAVTSIVNMKFAGANWSNKLWNNMKVIRTKVEKMASNMLIRGRHPNEFVKEVREVVKDRNTYEIKRLLLTEATRTRTEAQKLYFMETLGGDGEVKYVAKMDEKTSSICRQHNGDIIKVKDIVPGVNAPPMHPFCRSILVEHNNDWRDKFFAERKGKYGFGKVKIGD